MAETRPSEKFLNQQGQNQEKVIVNFYDGKQVRGYLSRLDYRDKYFQIQAVEGFEKAKILEVGFEEIQSMYFVHDFDQKLPHYRVDSGFWDRAFTKRVSGTVVFKWEEGRWIARFKKSRTDLGGIFFEPQKTGNVRRVFFPFPRKKSALSRPRLGDTLLSEGFISKEELEQGLQKQSELREKKIGDILVENAGIQPEAVENALKKQKSRFESKLGEILIAAGAVNQSQVEEALSRQKTQSSRRLGQILIDMGLVSEEMLALSVALKFGLPYVDLQDYPVDPAALECVSQNLARKLQIFPLKLKDHELTVAFSDPTNLDPKQDLTFYTGKGIKEVIATEKSIMQAIDEHYGKDSDEYLEKLFAGESEIEEVAEKNKEEYEIGEQTGKERPIIELVNHMLKTAVVKKASDLHIVPEGRRVKVELRIDGELYEELTLSSDRLPSVIARMKIMGNMNIAERRLPQDGRAKVKVSQKIVDLRFSCMPSIFGESMVVRLLDKESGVKSLDQLGFLDKELEELRKSQQKSYGMILVTGPTGSGKSSTIYACLQEPVFSNKNVIALEDPVEYELPGLTQVQIKESIGLTFAKGLRQILRHDPDVIVVGEIRDLETAKIAIQSALTGHLLYSTLHTNTAAEAFVRLGEMGVEPYLVSSSIVGIVAQRLIKRICPACSTKDEKALDKLAASRYPVQPSQDAVFFFGKGCKQCNQTGYQGRTVAYEYLVPDERIKRAAVTNKPASEIRRLARKQGMRTIEEIALRKAEQGQTSVDEIIPLINSDG
ncbi:MAG: Flp pilus assembly complex ATPase component TadA [Desulfohalobiaceae bacterium]|nr:Flp pilus assembly complex ATPase component TadA [Desulfohalobiaceae bacterium]